MVFRRRGGGGWKSLLAIWHWLYRSALHLLADRDPGKRCSTHQAAPRAFCECCHAVVLSCCPNVYRSSSPAAPPPPILTQLAPKTKRASYCVQFTCLSNGDRRKLPSQTCCAKPYRLQRCMHRSSYVGYTNQHSWLISFSRNETSSTTILPGLLRAETF